MGQGWQRIRGVTGGLVSAKTVDLVVVSFIALAALVGVWLGALRALSGLVCTAVVVALMLLGYAPLARLLERVPGLGPRLTTVVAFAVLAVAGQIIAVVVIQRPLLSLLGLLRRNRGLRWIDRLLGAMPGALAGCILA